jgi:F-type H+-transporting ATPase subunit b
MKVQPPTQKPWLLVSSSLAAVLFASLPAAAAESGPNVADSPVGMFFRWLNFAIVFVTIVWVIRKFGAPYFRGHAREIGGAIQQASKARAAAERELKEATQKLAALDLEIQDLRRAAVRESAAEAERIRERARVEAEKVAQAAQAEIAATERAARQELRAMAARLATERAAAMVRAQMTAQGEAALFRAFVSELRRSAP